MFSGVQIWALCRLVKFFHTRLSKSFLYGHQFAHRGMVMWSRNGISPNCCQKTGSTEFSWMSLHAAALPSLLELRGLANTKTTPHDYTTKLLLLRQVVFSWHKPNQHFWWWSMVSRGNILYTTPADDKCRTQSSPQLLRKEIREILGRERPRGGACHPRDSYQWKLLQILNFGWIKISCHWKTQWGGEMTDHRIKNSKNRCTEHLLIHNTWL